MKRLAMQPSAIQRRAIHRAALRLGALAVLVVSATAPAAESDSHILKNLDVFDIEFAADPQISPNGSQVVYVRQSMDIMTDRARGNLWLLDVDGDRHRPLFSDSGYSSPRWSPSGDRIAYVSSVEGRGAQIHVRWMDTGQTAMLSNVREPPRSLTWSPDGSSIAFSMFVPSDGASLATPPKAPDGADWAPAAKVIERLNYRADGRGYLDTGNTHLFLLSAEGGTPRQLTSGDYNHSGPLSFAPDGSSIVFSANRLDDYELQPTQSELWRVDVDSGELAQLTDRLGPDFAPRYSPDGSRIAYLGYDDQKMGYHNAGVYVMDADGGNVTAVTADFDRTIGAVSWSGSSNRLLVQYDDHGKRHIASLTLGGDLESIVDDVGGTSLGRPYTSGGFSVANNGTFAYTAGTEYRPAEVAVGRRARDVRKLTALNDDLLAHKRLGQVEAISWTSANDLEIEGWIVTPPDFDPEKTYPLILEIHGGPFAAYGPHFSTEVQLFAAAGYVVLYTNPRGSTSYGYDFANEIHHAYPSQDYDDLMFGVDAAIEKGYVNEDQLFVTGGSGGGVLTAWIVGKTDRFAAAVSAKPVINWISTVLTTDIGAFMPEYWFAEPPWVDPDSYWERSPLSLVGNVSTPTMLLTGEQDHRTPIPESEQYYQALKLRQIDTALVRIPEASHGIAARPSHLIAKVDNILAWFGRYRKDAD